MWPVTGNGNIEVVTLKERRIWDLKDLMVHFVQKEDNL